MGVTADLIGQLLHVPVQESSPKSDQQKPSSLTTVAAV